MDEINDMLWDLVAGLAIGHRNVCGVKRQHETEESAWEHARESTRLRPHLRERTPYACPWCWYWHVGKRYTKSKTMYNATGGGRYERSIAAAAVFLGDVHVEDRQGPPVVGAGEGSVEPQVPQDGLHGMAPGRDGGTLLEEDVGRHWLLVLQPEESMGLGTKCGTGGMDARAA